MISTIIKREFESKIRDTFKGKDDLISFFLNHPNRENCFLKVHSEITKAELLKPGLLNESNIKMLSQNFAIIFCKQALLEKEKEIITESQSIKLRKEQDERKYIFDRMEKEFSSDHQEF